MQKIWPLLRRLPSSLVDLIPAAELEHKQCSLAADRKGRQDLPLSPLSPLFSRGSLALVCALHSQNGGVCVFVLAPADVRRC